MKIPLSEQEYVDCARPEDGCNGGWEFEALEYSRIHDRISRSSDVPYEKHYNHGCSNGDMYRSKPNALEIAGVKIDQVFGASMTENRLPSADDILMNILSTRVASVGVYVDSAFMHYSSGVLNNHNCQKSANHAVGAVGYGTDSSLGLDRFQTQIYERQITHITIHIFLGTTGWYVIVGEAAGVKVDTSE